ncbi:unnamed protein product [Spirodela intermedia]|uniref:Uncharacterized protein n=1 Tax=Spirodela intermedia TaxID=51605 RepID=A0A7I8JD61_SPIIN|nr:unnamed protein product [Spirodela intermedia]CAA6668077.1 unnamed protein product [Spirodela intermedia]
MRNRNPRRLRPTHWPSRKVGGTGRPKGRPATGSTGYLRSPSTMQSIKENVSSIIRVNTKH